MKTLKFRYSIVIAIFIAIAICTFLYFQFFYYYINIVFNKSVGDLKSNNPVYLNKSPIGKINDIKLDKENKIIAKVRIFYKYRKNIKSGSVFVIDKDIRNPNTKCLLLYVIDKSAPSVNRGDRLIGYTSHSQMTLELTKKEVSKYINYLKEDLKNMWNILKSYWRRYAGRHNKVALLTTTFDRYLIHPQNYCPDFSPLPALSH